MSTDEAPLPERVTSYFSQLSAAAKDLNTISDELGKSIAEIDLALKQLNLGVVVWTPISASDGTPDESWYWSEDVGYAKIGPHWGISLRKVTGDYQDPENEKVESWLFSDAPRTLRLSAIGKIPDLLAKLSEEAVDTARKIRARLSEAQVVAEAVKGAARPRPQPRPVTGTHAVSPPPKIPVLVVDSSADAPKLDFIRKSVIDALATAGHSAAAQLLGSGTWTLEDSAVCIEVPGMGKKMLALTVNSAAEKIIRAQLQRLGLSDKFLVVPGTSTRSGEEATK